MVDTTAIRTTCYFGRCDLHTNLHTYRHTVHTVHTWMHTYTHTCMQQYVHAILGCFSWRWEGRWVHVWIIKRRPLLTKPASLGRTLKVKLTYNLADRNGTGVTNCKHNCSRCADSGLAPTNGPCKTQPLRNLQASLWRPTSQISTNESLRQHQAHRLQSFRSDGPERP